jgi:hypothetical protein
MSKFFIFQHADKKKKNPLPKVITLGWGSYGLKSPYRALKGLLSSLFKLSSEVSLGSISPLNCWGSEAAN